MYVRYGIFVPRLALGSRKFNFFPAIDLPLAFIYKKSDTPLRGAVGLGRRSMIYFVYGYSFLCNASNRAYLLIWGQAVGLN